MPMMSGFFDDANAWLADLTKPAGGGGFQVTRQNPQTGRTQIQVPDPDRRGYVIWVDAMWNPARDLMIPIDPRYREPEQTYPVNWSMRLPFSGSGESIDFSGPLNLDLPGGSGAPAAEIQLPVFAHQSNGESGSGVWMLVGGLVLLYFLSR